MKKLGLSFLFLFLIGPLLAAPPAIKVPDAATGDTGDFIEVPATTDAAVVKWVVMDKGLNLFPMRQLKDSKTAIVIGKKAGIYRLLAYTSNVDGASDPAICTITIGTPEPPAPPIPPGPPTPPTPPEPPDPFMEGGPVTPGLRCVMVYSTDPTTGIDTYPRAQQQILWGGPTLAYLRTHCVKGSGGAPDWRCYPETVKYDDEDSATSLWKKVMARPRKSLPWVIIGNGKTGYEGPLPANGDEMVKLLQKYGGQ